MSRHSRQASAIQLVEDCPHCGGDLHLANRQAQAKIEDLEHQLHILSTKAAQEADRSADLEDELAQLAAVRQTALRASSNSNSPSRSASTKLFSLLGRRNVTPDRESAVLGAADSSTGPMDTAGELEMERERRELAERKLAEANGELEELSQTLFEEANSIVASERRQRARVEEKLQSFQARNAGTHERLSKIEDAISRRNRVAQLLGE